MKIKMHNGIHVISSLACVVQLNLDEQYKEPNYIIYSILVTYVHTNIKLCLIL